ncbi:MAG: TonB-dependent receptor [Calditrichaeota bacterium]|nr:TonB-dependent receptor [Calditrichota bacterium]MCB9369387.1 TonB-dependent receptor [Calditrichota bacterium]
MIRYLTYLVLAMIAAVPAAGATLLRGTISDLQTGEGLLGVNIQLVGTLRGTSTSEDGKFTLHLPNGGEWTLRVSSIGYRTTEHKFTIGENDTLTQNIQLDPDLLQADEVVITAQARETTARLSTTKVEVVRSTEVQNRAPSSLDRVLDAVPGVDVHRTGGAIVSNVSIRGSSDKLGGGVGNRTLLLVDGRPAVISDTDGASWQLYPEDVIERVEVVKGAYSALYGSNAMGGVVNMITHSPTHREYTRIRAGYGIYQKPPAWARYTERMTTRSDLSFSHSNSVGRLGYFTNFTRRNSEGWRQSSASENLTAFTKLVYDYTPERSLTLSNIFLDGENEYPHPWESVAEPLRVRDIYTNDLQRKQTFSSDLVYRRIESPRSNYTLRFFYNRDLTRSLFNPSSEPREGDTPIDFQTRSLSQKLGILEKSTKIAPGGHTLVFGFDATWDFVKGVPEDYLYGRQQAVSLAGFGQDDWTVHKSVHLTAGARYDYRHLVSGKSTQQVSPKAGISYEARKNVVLRGSVGHAFRNPSIAEMFLKKVGTQDYEFVPNPDLDPETVDFGEVGVNCRINDHVVMDAAGFHYDYNDIIRWQVLAGGRFKTENLAEAQIDGGEFSIRSAWPRNVNTVFAATYLHTDINNEGPLTYVPEWRFFVGAEYTYRRTTYGFEMRHVAKTDTVVFYQNDAPDAFTVMNARIAFQFRQSTRLSLHVENLTNVQYEEMERYRMPPRTYRVELLYDFDFRKQD